MPDDGVTSRTTSSPTTGRPHDGTTDDAGDDGTTDDTPTGLAPTEVEGRTALPTTGGEDRSLLLLGGALVAAGLASLLVGRGARRLVGRGSRCGVALGRHPPSGTPGPPAHPDVLRSRHRKSPTTSPRSSAHLRRPTDRRRPVTVRPGQVTRSIRRSEPDAAAPSLDDARERRARRCTSSCASWRTRPSTEPDLSAQLRPARSTRRRHAATTDHDARPRPLQLSPRAAGQSLAEDGPWPPSTPPWRPAVSRGSRRPYRSTSARSSSAWITSTRPSAPPSATGSTTCRWRSTRGASRTSRAVGRSTTPPTSPTSAVTSTSLTDSARSQDEDALRDLRTTLDWIKDRLLR